MLFLGGPGKGSMSKTDVFQQICLFLLAKTAKHEISTSRFYLSDIDFTNLLFLRDEPIYVDCQTSTCLRQ